MFNNIGSKIKKVAEIFCWLGIIGYAVCGIVMFILAENASYYDETPYIIYGFLLIILGPISSWLSSLILYAFGKLVEDVEAIRDKRPPVVKLESERNGKQLTQETSQNIAKKEKSITPPMPSIHPRDTVTVEQNSVEKKESKQEQKISLPCPECGEDLRFMGWDESDLGQNQTCPMCGKEISFNK